MVFFVGRPADRPSGCSAVSGGWDQRYRIIQSDQVARLTLPFLLRADRYLPVPQVKRRLLIGWPWLPTTAPTATVQSVADREVAGGGSRSRTERYGTASLHLLGRKTSLGFRVDGCGPHLGGGPPIDRSFVSLGQAKSTNRQVVKKKPIQKDPGR